MEQIPVTHYLVLSTVLFCLGVLGFFIRRNMIALLMSVELILNSVNINFVVFNRFLYPENMEGVFFILFIITIAAAEVSVGLAITINLYRKFKSIDIEETDQLKY